MRNFASSVLTRLKRIMEKKRILYVSQEITPYLPESPISKLSQDLPTLMNEAGHEVRIFMPRFGCINERRHQLHEVIRLSGMNLIVNDMDQPLIIKVASIPTSRIQVYFIDNEEYFKRKATLTDDKGDLFADNDERSLFFCRGVLETVKKLGWKPDVIHAHGWMTSMLPIYLKKNFADDPIFEDSKLVYSLYNNEFSGSLSEDMAKKIKLNEGEKCVETISTPDFVNLNKIAIEHSDAVTIGTEGVSEDLKAHATDRGLPLLDVVSDEERSQAYQEFYQEILVEESVA